MQPATTLPDWPAVLAVVAHPDDESFGLGAVLAGFVTAGRTVSVLCLTRGEASTLHGVAGDLAEVRATELQLAAQALGITRVGLKGFPDNGLTSVPLADLIDEIASFAEGQAVDGVLVFDPNGITGHPDHQRATEAALAFASAQGIPVLAWTLPQSVADTLRAETGAPFRGHAAQEIDIVVDVDRTRQARAVDCHPSQAVPGSVLWRRLDMLGPHEHLRWLHHHDPSTSTPPTHPSLTQTEGSTP